MPTAAGEVLDRERTQQPGHPDGEDCPPRRWLRVAQFLGQGVPHELFEFVYGGEEAEGDEGERDAEQTRDEQQFQISGAVQHQGDRAVGRLWGLVW